MVLLDNFLGCCKLRTGCLFIGYCGTIVGMLGIILSLVAIILTAFNENHVTGDKKTTNEIIMAVAIYILVICILSFALHVVLLKGVYEKRPRLLNVYVIAMTTYLVLTFILAIIVAVNDLKRGLSYIVSLGVSVYYLLVVKSHRMELENLKRQPVAYLKA